MTLAVRLGRGVAAGWIGGLAILGLVLGLVAQSASVAVSGSASIQRAIERLGGYRPGAATYLGVAFLTAASMVTFLAAGQIGATRDEEAQTHVEHLLVRAVSRWRWLVGRLVVSAGLVVVASLLIGVAAWAGAATQHAGVGFSQLVQAGLNVAAPALFVLGLGALVYGLLPRWTTVATYTIVGWSLLVEIVASLVKSNRWLLDSSVLSHIRPAPAADPNWASAGWLVGLGLAAALLGVIAFTRRDLAGA
jgi:ABC-2 type transport system permease protein